jgi:hypothetical protein
MSFEPGQEVSIKKPLPTIGKILKLKETDPTVGELYLVEIDRQTLLLRAADFEVLNGTGDETGKLIFGTQEWAAEAQRASAMLQAVLGSSTNDALRVALSESLEALGLMSPIRPATQS